MTISLKNRLALTYALFISLALGALTLALNFFTRTTFNELVRENIAAKSEEIVREAGDRYNPLSRSFDALSIEAVGMHFVHEGYIVSVEDERGNLVWDARSCDMQQCMDTINSIAGRMEGRFRLNGALRKDQYPVIYAGRTVGTVSIETWGPFFYSETETKFLTFINRLLLVGGITLTLVSILVSTALARAIAWPVKKAGEAARKIAQVHSGGMNPEGLVIRIPDQYRTRELAELSRSLNELAAELEAAESRQRRLGSDIAHELRTPLACLQGDLEAMIDGVYEPDRKRLESCHEEIMRLAGLVRDLGVLTGIEGESGGDAPVHLRISEFDLAKLLQAAAEQFRAAAAEKGITITAQLQESPIAADYDRLKQVFINLLSNAVKYTDRGGIRITLGQAARPAAWEVRVADTGIGIPENDLPHIFERFYRSDKSRSRSTGGAGIGLTIAAAIVHAHGGSISAESPAALGTPGASGGSLFRVILPEAQD
jgi:signal transduction histidine kinase